MARGALPLCWWPPSQWSRSRNRCSAFEMRQNAVDTSSRGPMLNRGQPPREFHLAQAAGYRHQGERTLHVHREEQRPNRRGSSRLDPGSRAEEREDGQVGREPRGAHAPWLPPACPMRTPSRNCSRSSSKPRSLFTRSSNTPPNGLALRPKAVAARTRFCEMWPDSATIIR